MPLFPVIDIEALVQEQDKTRLDVAKSYASGTTPITKLEVSPSIGVDPIEVTEDGFLDWQYEFKIDIVEDENDVVDFSEGSNVLQATLDEGEYTLAELAEEIATKMTAVGAFAYEASVSAANALTIAADDEFILLGESGVAADDNSVLPLIGFGEDTDAAETTTGEKVKRITRKITCTVTNDDGAETRIREIEVISEVADRLFSADDRLRKHESNIMKYVPEGRATFKDVHRRVQTLILAWIDTQGFVTTFNEKFTLDDFVDTEEAAEWATMMALKLIFQDAKNAKDDVFSDKIKYYAEQELFFRGRAVLRVDTNRDGTAIKGEGVDIRSCRVVRS